MDTDNSVVKTGGGEWGLGWGGHSGGNGDICGSINNFLKKEKNTIAEKQFFSLP